MDYCLLSINHQTAPIALREQVSLSTKQLEQVYKNYPTQPGQEWMLLSTCNRIELIGHGFLRPQDELPHLLSQLTQVPATTFAQHLTIFTEADAVKHCFRVASGLDSMVLGEPQILGQWKDAFQLATHMQHTGPYLSRLGQRTLQTAKRIRTETGIGRFAINMATLAVELAKEIFDPLAQKKALVLGAGEMAKIATTQFLAHGVQELAISNRTKERGLALTSRYNARFIAWPDWPDFFRHCDILLVGIGDEERIVQLADIKEALRHAPNHPRLIIDLGMPRAVDPEISKLTDIFLYAVDDLERLSQTNRQKRAAEAKQAEILIEQAAQRFNAWHEEQRYSPLLSDFSRWLEEKRQTEIAKTLAKRADRSVDELLESATSAINRRLIQQLALALREQKTEAGAIALLQTFLHDSPDIIAEQEQ